MGDFENAKMDETILTISWKKEDLVNALAEHEIEVSDENIERLLKCFSGNMIRKIEEESISRGWEIIHNQIEYVFENENT